MIFKKNGILVVLIKYVNSDFPLVLEIKSHAKLVLHLSSGDGQWSLFPKDRLQLCNCPCDDCCLLVAYFQVIYVPYNGAW